jgi:hypothetical protein
MGDFNLDLQKPQPSWESTFSIYGLNQLVNEPTRVTPTSSTLLDHIYTNNDNKIVNVRLSDVSVSDHSATMCTWLCKSLKTKKASHTTIVYRCFKKFDQNKFLSDLNCADFSAVYSCSTPNDAVSMWYNIFLPIVDKHAPVRKKRVKQQTLPGWLTSDIIQAMEIRDRLKKEKKFAEYKKQRNVVSMMVQVAKQKYFDTLITNNSDIGQLWRAMNDITNKSNRSKHHGQTPITPEEFNSHFLTAADRVLSTSTSQTHSAKSPYDLLDKFCTEHLLPGDSCSIPDIAVHEMGKYLSSLKNKKSMGIDNLNAFIIKLSIPYIVESLTYISNLCIKTNTFPDAWKAAKVIPLPKASDLQDPNNFRPISILSILSKPIEKHVHSHILKFIERHDLFHEFQSGFRKNHSCHSALTHMCDTWLTAINKLEIAGSIFLDLKKAFDLVDHNIMIEKLKRYVNNDSTVNFVASFLSDRSQCVFVNGATSTYGRLTVGVPQGSILGPLLFCLYINDLPLYIDKNVVCEMFADDSSLHTTSPDIKTVQDNLQTALSAVDKWCSTNKMVVHPKKTKSMVITSRQKHQRLPLKLNLCIGTDNVEQVKTHRVLGVTIDDELKWQTHITNVCKTVARNVYLLGKLKFYVDSDARLMFFNAHVMSHINYASTVWSNAGDVHLKKLNSLHRRAAKSLVSNSYLSTDEKLISLNILPLNKQFELNTAVLVYKARNALVPAYVHNLLVNSDNRYASGKYILPRTRIDLYKTSFSFAGASIWNSLQLKARSCKTLSSFKSSVKKHFLLNSFLERS